MGVQSREILSFVDSCGAHTQDIKIISEEHNSCVLSTELHKRVTTCGFGHHKVFQIVI